MICTSGRSSISQIWGALVTDLPKCGSALAALALLSLPGDRNTVGFAVGTQGDRSGALAATLGVGESLADSRHGAGIGQFDHLGIRERCECALQLQAVAALVFSAGIYDRLAAIRAGDASQGAALGAHDRVHTARAGDFLHDLDHKKRRRLGGWSRREQGGLGNNVGQGPPEKR